MRRRALLLCAAAAACRSALEPERWSLGRALASTGRAAGEAGGTDEAWLIDELETIAECARRLAPSGDPARGIVRALFDELGFVREVESTDLGFVCLPGVLRERRGSCVGLGTLYLALAEALGSVAYGVLRPGHFHVRHGSPGAARNVELLRRGEAMDDDWYQQRYPIPDGTDYYARPLTTEQVLGVVDYNVGNERRRQERYAEAEAAYSRATLRFLGFAEAHASLGAMQHLRGDLRGAAASYRSARQLNPALPGLAANIAMLDAERSAAR